jgi:hypothetical protein
MCAGKVTAEKHVLPDFILSVGNTVEVVFNLWEHVKGCEN